MDGIDAWSLSMDAQSARAILSMAPGWIEWSVRGDCPDWQNGRIALDGRFTVDELRAVLAFAFRRESVRRPAS